MFSKKFLYSFATWSKAAPDNSYISDHRVVGSFHTDSYTYFLGSAKRNDLPFALFSTSHKSDRQRTDVRLTRICNQDKTVGLESRIDIVLSCDGIGIGVSEAFELDNRILGNNADLKWLDDRATVINDVATAMTLTDNKLYAVFQKKNKNGETSKTVVCSYELQQLYRAFDNAWDTCQDIDNAKDVQEVVLSFEKHLLGMRRRSELYGNERRVFPLFMGEDEENQLMRKVQQRSAHEKAEQLRTRSS